MKKAAIVLVLIMAVMVANAQTTKTTVVKEKPLRSVVQLADLPKPITDNIAKDYVGYTVKEAASVTANKVSTYEVVVVKGTTTETLVYDKDGVFVKKLPASAHMKK